MQLVIDLLWGRFLPLVAYGCKTFSRDPFSVTAHLQVGATRPPLNLPPISTARRDMSMTHQTLTITTRKSDGAIGVQINGRSVVTVTKSGKKAIIVGRNLKDIQRGTSRGANRHQFDLSKIIACRMLTFPKDNV
jgi:hypothetical protein